MKVYKLDAAALHIGAAIKMIAINCNPFSVHLLCMAAEEIVSSVAKDRGVILPYDFEVWIKPGYRKEFHRTRKAAYNFLKHADRDPNDLYNGPDTDSITKLNDLLLTMSIFGLRELKFDMPPHFYQFIICVAVLYQNLYDWDALTKEKPELAEHIKAMQSGEFDRGVVVEGLRGLLQKSQLLVLQ